MPFHMNLEDAVDAARMQATKTRTRWKVTRLWNAAAGRAYVIDIGRTYAALAFRSRDTGIPLRKEDE